MRLGIVELDASFAAGFGQHGLAEGETGQGGGVKVGKGMKGIALDFTAFYPRSDKAGVKMGIVRYQHRAATLLVPDFLAYHLENFGESFVFIHRFPERVVGVYPGKVQCRLLEVSPLKRLNMKAVGTVHSHLAIFVHTYDGCRNFQYGIGARNEASRFNVDNYRQKTPETIANLVVRREVQAADLPCPVTCQAISVPARSGVRNSFPRGSCEGTVQASFSRVIVSVLRGRR